MIKKSIIFIICIVILLLSFSSCSRKNDDSYNYINSKYESVANNLYELITDYVAANPNYYNDYFENSQLQIDNLSALTKCEYVGEVGSGRLLNQFKYDEHLTFVIADMPFREVFFYIDNNVYRQMKISI